MKFYRIIIRLFVGLAAVLSVMSAGAVTFTTSTTIDASDTNYDGQDIVVSGCTLTVNGTHSFASVEVTDGSVLTQEATTTNQTYSLQIAITGALVVDATSSINVSGLGYLPGYTLGNTNLGGATYLAGGSYGGSGYSYSGGGTGNAVYGNYLSPNELGSGSGNYSTGGSGGGLAHITAASAQLNGDILANGGNSYDGGSGGGIYLSVGALSGTGAITANGGSASGNNGGGGGRVAIYYTSVSGFNLTNNVTAVGGTGPSGGGSAGTVYFQQSGQLGELLINNGGPKGSAWTPLGLSTDTVFQVDNLVIVGTNTVAATTGGAPIQASSVTVVDGAVLTHQATTTNQAYSLVMTITNGLVLDATSAINVSGQGYLPGYTVGNTTNGGATYLAGGSYGGAGYLSGGGATGNAVYGNYLNPNELGSGSGNYAPGDSGGGLARITAASAQLNGEILADGGSSYNGGSGGGIYLNIGALSGTGTITANGGSASGNNGGGGGRVAIYYTSVSGFNLTNNVTAIGGTGPSGGGSAGTVYFQQSGQLGELLINNGGPKGSAWTPLGLSTDTVFQVDNLVIVGTNTVAVTAAGAPIQASSVTVVDGAVLAHQTTTTNQSYSLVMTITNGFVLDASSSINVSGLGYQFGYTVGNTTNGAATFTAGGSYGGVGSICCGSTTDPVYGDYHNPNDLGSGSGTYFGVPGGGLVRITAGSAQINGEILANGENSYDGSSGGGIYLNIGALSGTGAIAANGGSGNGNDGGGGGRVAVYYTTDSGFNLTNNVTAVGGSGPSGAGSAGSVYLQQNGQLGELLINNNGAGVGGLTPLGETTDTVFQVDNLVIVGSNTVAATPGGAPIQANSVTVVNGAVLAHQATTTNQTYSLVMTITNSFMLDASSSINVSGLGYQPNYTVGNTTNGGATFTAGGSYGGLGALCCGSTGDVVYGDYHNPNDLGSGSGTYFGVPGGGLVRITAGSAQIDGQILANGDNSYDGASGGGIYLNIGALSGTGTIAANGGSADGNDGGGGGRVAILYTSDNGFNLTNNVSVIGGFGPSGGGSAGTIYLQQSGQLGQLLINNNGTATSLLTPLGETTDTVFQVDNLVIVGTNTVAATVSGAPIQANSVTILGGGNLTHQPATIQNTYSLQLNITSNLLIDATSAINVTGMGYLADYTQGNTTGGASTFTAGGSYGGLGAVCCGSTANAVYGDYHNPDDLGSGSGTYGNGAPGGGLVRVTANSAQINGAILANGGNGYDGGSGGGILVNIGTLSGNGTIAANGGKATGNDGGGGGRVAIYAWASQNIPQTNITANGGIGPSFNGQNGSAYIATTPFFIWGNSPELWHGTEQIAWQALGGNPGSTVEVSITRNGVTYLNESGVVGPGFINWDTTTVADGVYVITANFINGSGQAIGQLWQDAEVNNSASYYSGLITTNETWSATNLNVIDGNVTIPSGVTVTVAPGAVIKVAKGFQIIVQPGGTFNTSGATSADPIILTSLDDSSVGGNTLAGVDSSTPQPGDWSGVVTTGGQFLQNPFVDLRYVLFNLGGTLSTNQTLSSTFLYIVTSPVVVPTNVTLTIDLGTVIKFDIGMNITVQAGGNLVALGTVAQPITFTSINDDSVGGDRNGGATSPAPGDWDSIYISGGTAEFDHVIASYGASQNLPAGLITSTDPASVVTISDSIIQQGLYDGIQDAAGTVMITNCVVTGCDRGIQSGLSGAAQVTVVNCTLDNNNYGIFFHGGGASVANTIVANSLQGGIVECCGSAVTAFQYNDVWAPNGLNYNNSTWPYPDQTGTNGNISVNPNFINETNGAYQLNYLSPCIDAANSLIAPATDLVGDPRYNDPLTPIKTGIPNASGVYADIGAYEFVQNAPSTVDLVPTTVNGPTSVNPGDQVAVTWTVVNKGIGPAVGPWHDTLSLLPLDGSSNAIPVATELVEQDSTLGAGQSYTESVVVRVPSGPEGNYLWQVHVNSQGEIFEGENVTNNVADASVATSLTLPTLTVGGTLSSEYTATGQGDLYEISPGAGQNLVITLQDNAPGTALELYIAQGYTPTVSQFDYKSSQFNTNVVSLTVPNTIGGEYYVLAYARSLNSSDVDYTISAAAVSQFAVSVVSPGEITDSGPVTLQLTGGLLAGNDTYQLVGPGGTFAATNIVGPNPDSSFVTFNLAGAASGNYSLVITQPNGQSTTNLNAVSVNDTPALPQFSVQLQVPSIYRIGRAFNGLIQYGNIGNADMPSPLLILSSGGIAGLQLLPTDSYMTNDLVLVAAAMEGPAGVLRPGQTYTIPFSALPNSPSSIPFQVDYKLADSTDSVDYASLSSQVRPPGYSDDDWNLIWNSFQASAGSTWGGFVQLVDHYSTIMAEEPGSASFYSLPDVLAYAFSDRLTQLETSVAGTLYLGDTNHPLSQTFLSISDTNYVTGVAQTFVDGTFRITSLTGGVYSVNVPNYWLPAPILITVPATGSITNVNIIVQQGATIQGVVYDQFGILFLTNVDVEASSTTTNSVFDTTTGADGSYVLGGLPPDSYTVIAGTGSYPVQQTAAQFVGDDQTWTTNFYLFAGATVEGRVLASSEPLANAVAYFTDANSNVTTSVSDTAGVFEINGLAAGSWIIQVQADGYGPYTLQTNLLAGQTLNLGSVTLQPAANIVVALDNTSNQPVTLADLSLYQNGSFIGEQYADSNGIAIFSNLDAGTYQLTGIEYGYLDLSNNISVSAGATVTNIVYLNQLGSISGRVTDGSGLPLADLVVNISGLNSNNQSTVFAAITDANGNFTLIGLISGPYLVAVGNNGGIMPQQVTIDNSLDSLTVNFVLKDTLISGAVVNSDGVTSLSNATVLLSQSNQLVATALADTNGLYRFRVVTPGTYSLSAGAQAVGLTPGESIVVPANTNLEAPLLKIGSLQFSGSIYDGSGAPQAGAVVVLFQNNGQSAAANFSAVAASNGQFVVTGLIPGAYALQIRDPGFATVMQVITIAGNTSRDFVVAAGAVAQGTVTDASTGQIITNAVVSFFDPVTKFPVDIIPTGTSGNYSLSDLSLTNYDVIVNDGIHRVKELADVNITSNNFTLNVALAKANTSLGGTITDIGANPISGAAVSIIDTNTGETLFDTTTATDGTWSTSQLPAGSYGFGLVAIGYLVPSSTNILLAANVPQIFNTVVTPAATDDAPPFFEGIAQQIGLDLLSLFKKDQPERGAYLPAPAPACACANDAWKDYQKALAVSDLLYSTWSDGYYADATITGASTGVAGAHALRLLADALAAFTPAGKAAAAVSSLQNLSEAEKAAAFAIKGVTLEADIAQGINSFLIANQDTISHIDLSNPASVKEGVIAILGTTGDLTAAGLGGHSITELSEALHSQQAGVGASDAKDVVLDALTVGVDLFAAVNDYKEAVEAVESAEENYNEAYQDYVHSVHALVVANADCKNCPPPTPPTTPPPPNPTPGQTNIVNPGGANDPNDKLTTGVGPAGFVRPGESILFTVLFENEPTATLPAQEVVITDQLDPQLNWATVQLGDIGFNNVTIQVPPGVQTFSTNVYVTTDPNPVQVNGSLNITNGLLTWVIQSVDPVTGQAPGNPLAGFLPPDNTNGDGEGYVTYTVSSQTNDANGAVINNQANVVFDANAPILTPVTTNTIDSAPPQSYMTPLPTSATNLDFLVQWSGTDYSGSGVASYNVYVATNSGAFGLWLFDTTNTSATFTGQLFSRYSFYTVAVDNVGNIQAAPTTAQATTTVADVISLTPSIPDALAVIDGETVVRAGESNIFLATGQDQYDLPLTYQWSFGDGASTGLLTTNTVMHAYPGDVSGTYLASVTASNGYIAVTKELTVIAAFPLTITKGAVDANFALADADSIALTATMDLVGLTKVTQLNAMRLVVDVGNAQISFTLNNKGTATSANGTCKLVYTPATKTLPGFWTLTAALSHGEWHNEWAAYGLTDATIPKPGVTITMPVAVIVGSQTFATDQPLDYTATLNKTGSAVRDVTKPTLSITTPTAGQRLDTAMLVVKGKAADLVAVESVFYNLNNTGWYPGYSTNKWATWTGAVTLTPGANTLLAYAVDTSGNVSPTNTVKFTYVLSAELTVHTNGGGSITPVYNDALLQVGASYSMVARPKAGWAFVDWTDALDHSITNSATLKFVMESNLTYVANFIDVQRPTLTITAPANMEKTTNTSVEVKGAAKDNQRVTEVWYQLNNGGWNMPASANGWTNWNVTVPLVLGTNIFEAYAVDPAGNLSTTNTVRIISIDSVRKLLAITDAILVKDEGLQFSLQVPAGTSGHIEFSTDLTTWSTLTNFVATKSTLIFHDPDAVNSSQRYYRAVVP